jgi:hypothetical protein
MQELIRKVIEHANYEIEGTEPTEQDVINCFLDYVDCQYYRDLTVDEAKQMYEDGEITFKEICNNILKIK